MAIGEAIEKELQGRVGNPQLKEANVENFPPLQPEGKTRDLVAKATGWFPTRLIDRFSNVTARCKTGARLVQDWCKTGATPKRRCSLAPSRCFLTGNRFQ